MPRRERDGRDAVQASGSGRLVLQPGVGIDVLPVEPQRATGVHHLDRGQSVVGPDPGPQRRQPVDALVADVCSGPPRHPQSGTLREQHPGVVGVHHLDRVAKRFPGDVVDAQRDGQSGGQLGQPGQRPGDLARLDDDREHADDRAGVVAYRGVRAGEVHLLHTIVRVTAAHGQHGVDVDEWHPGAQHVFDDVAVARQRPVLRQHGGGGPAKGRRVFRTEDPAVRLVVDQPQVRPVRERDRYRRAEDHAEDSGKAGRPGRMRTQRRIGPVNGRSGNGGRIRLAYRLVPLHRTSAFTRPAPGVPECIVGPDRRKSLFPPGRLSASE